MLFSMQAKMAKRGPPIFGRCSMSTMLMIIMSLLSIAMAGINIDAAFSYNPPDMHDNFLYLISGQKVILLRNKILYMHYDRHYLRIPDAMNLEATSLMSNEHRSILFFGDKYGYLKTYIGDLLNRRLNYGVKRRFFRMGGPDAIAKRARRTFLFKGCRMVERINWNHWTRPRSVRHKNLPCPVHAAWEEGNDMILLQWDQIWRWDLNGTVTGPSPFHETYNIKWWTLKTSADEDDNAATSAHTNGVVSGGGGGDSKVGSDVNTNTIKTMTTTTISMWYLHPQIKIFDMYFL